VKTYVCHKDKCFLLCMQPNWLTKSRHRLQDGELEHLRMLQDNVRDGMLRSEVENDGDV